MQTSFIGIRAAQSLADFQLWEQFLSKTNFARIIEIGTYRWGMSLFFWLWCKTKGAEFYTYDVKSFPATRVIRDLGITTQFRLADVFTIKEEIGNLIGRSGITIVFCDGGDKPKELRTFSHYLKQGDFIVVHDWGTEVKRNDVPRTLKSIKQGGLTYIFQYA